MQKQIQSPVLANTDFLSSYEKAMKDVVSGCGSRESVNSMLNELHAVYQRTSAELKQAKGGSGKREALLRSARADSNRIIEKYAPHTSHQFHELVLSYSFAAIALTLPLVAAASLITTIVGITAVGSTYFISAKILKDWKANAGRNTISGLSSVISPRHIKGLPKIIGVIRKK